VEETVYLGRKSWINHAGVIVLAGLLFCASGLLLAQHELRAAASAGMLVAVLLAIAPVISVYSTRYTVTSERVIQRNGLISRRTSQVEITDIRNVQVKQGILQRIFGVGDVGVSTAAQAGLEIEFKGIRSPQVVADAIRARRKG
jgi:uncharacterized membrane protein YdbT with pleckstrin-like domain